MVGDVVKLNRRLENATNSRAHRNHGKHRESTNGCTQILMVRNVVALYPKIEDGSILYFTISQKAQKKTQMSCLRSLAKR